MSEQRFTFRQMQQCATREVAQRQRAYPRWIENGRMTEAKAKHETACMQAIEAHLRKLADEEDAKGRLL